MSESLNEQAKRTLLRTLPHPLNICGVKEGETVNGFTLSWTTQASFKPPLVAIGVRQESQSHAMLIASQVFAISFLEQHQKEIAELFFKPQQGTGARFGEVEYELGAITGCPVLKDCLGYVECRVQGQLAGGDHSIFMGEVVAAHEYRTGDPLWLSDTSWQYGG
ncbi:flavin reductase family protein [Lyngbya confervoides]|uniref:Flavin reductase family protein n=1 Tax=Lyngbya confervoides BDU141951 TaxID=1574623 RepID=A0ABD4T3L4_9CYAN|nr:flavin reductase family protein [Lyngbya confervoides]MCM1983038.1 flavin reductase family protein [Lyngbya confervoides BDU141951]